MQNNQVVLVTGTQKELDERLTEGEHDALDAFYDAIESQGSIETLDDDTKKILEKIWIVRKTTRGKDPVHKSFIGDGTIFKRSDYYPCEEGSEAT